MPSDPERPIEKLLRDCARERRDRAGNWELHPADRRLLQQEVAQKFGKRKTETRPGLLQQLYSQWWTKAIGGMAIVALAAVIVRFSHPSTTPKGNEMLLARNEPMTRSKASVADEAGERAVNKPELNEARQRSLQESPMPSKTLLAKEEALELRRDAGEKDAKVGSTLSATETKQKGAQVGLLADRETSAPHEAATPSGQPLPTTDQPAEAFRKRYGFAGGQVASPPPSPAAAPAGAVVQNTAKPDPLTTLSSAVPVQQPASAPVASARFAASTANQVGDGIQTKQLGFFASKRIDSRQQQAFMLDQKAVSSDAVKKEAEPISSPVLTYFRVEQSGSELKIIDSDESVYVGRIEPQPTSPAQATSSSDLSQSKRSELRRAVPAETPVTKQTALRSQMQQSSLPGYPFEVIGTNRTSNQRVVFSGVLTGLTNTVELQGAARDTPVTSLGRSQFSDQTRTVEQNVHISGNVRIGPSQQLDIDAAPAPSR